MSKQAMEMVRQAWEEAGEGWTVPLWFVEREKSFERFAELIRADERAKMAEQPAQPLTDEQIWREYQALWPFHPAEEPRLAADLVTFARAIEAAHGITKGNT